MKAVIGGYIIDIESDRNIHKFFCYYQKKSMDTIGLLIIYAPC